MLSKRLSSGLVLGELFLGHVLPLRVNGKLEMLYSIKEKVMQIAI